MGRMEWASLRSSHKWRLEGKAEGRKSMSWTTAMPVCLPQRQWGEDSERGVSLGGGGAACHCKDKGFPRREMAIIVRF